MESRAAFIAFCWRDSKIRPISARYMHAREVARYASGFPEIHPHTQSPPDPLIAALKAQVKARGIPYQRLIREALERALAEDTKT